MCLCATRLTGHLRGISDLLDLNFNVAMNAVREEDGRVYNHSHYPYFQNFIFNILFNLPYWSQTLFKFSAFLFVAFQMTGKAWTEGWVRNGLWDALYIFHWLNQDFWNHFYPLFSTFIWRVYPPFAACQGANMEDLPWFYVNCNWYSVYWMIPSGHYSSNLKPELWKGATKYI